MSRRSQHFRRHLQNGDNVSSLSSRILEHKRVAGKRFEKKLITDKEGNVSTRDIAVGPSTLAMSRDKAVRLATTILRK